LTIIKQRVGNIETKVINSTTKGISPYEVAITVEAWLEQAKEQLKKPIKDSLK